MDLTLRSALVTGANRGIGLHTVHALFDAGVARVYAGARDPAKLKPLVKKYKDKVVPLELDVTRMKDINAAAKAAKDVTVLVNNAGVAEMGPLLDKQAPKKLKQEWDVNVLGVLNMTRVFAPILEKNGGGCVVNLNSVASIKSMPFAPTYCASKAAAFSVTQGLRNELEHRGILVISVFPGPIETDMADGLDMETTDPRHVGDEIVRALHEEHAFLLPDPWSLEFWHRFEREPGTVLAEITPPPEVA
jgi:NAD(P)-dependent dehydrogenase (short-subunit alcohol dehydrogenase family)